MSGSIGGHRIPTLSVRPTVDDYINKVLTKIDCLGEYKKCAITGSYNVIINKGETKPEGHGDIDLVIYIDSKHQLKDVKKSFKSQCEQLPDDVICKFKSGKRIGDKAQMFGDIVTIGFPIYGMKDEYVQIDNIIVTSEDEFNYRKSFLDMNAQKQALCQGLMRVILNYEDRNEIADHFKFDSLNDNDEDFEYEFVLGPCKLSLRKVWLDENRKELNRSTVFESNNWEDIKWMLRHFDVDSEYEDMLTTISNIIIDERSRRRIVGVLKSMINVGIGEIGTPKGRQKEESIKLAENILLF